MNRDEFSKFIAEQILAIKKHSFDMFYDIRKIMNIDREKRGNINDPMVNEFHLMIRDSGCDLVERSDENYNLYFERSTKVYQLTFCWNSEYMNNEDLPFCRVKELPAFVPCKNPSPITCE